MIFKIGDLVRVTSSASLAHKPLVGAVGTVGRAWGRAVRVCFTYDVVGLVLRDDELELVSAVERLAAIKESDERARGT